MRICLGVCGSIAAYRSPDLVKELKKQGHEVQVILTRAATAFVTTKTLESFSGKPVLSHDSFDETHFATDHIASARWADAFVVYGATANSLARMSVGLGDDFLSLQLLAFTGPVWVAPAMNPQMWQHPSVQENVTKLKKNGVGFIGPIEGVVACGESGMGHVAEISAIVQALSKEPHKTEALLKGKKILFSAGPMRSSIDDVRYIQNRSSGKMALALIEEAYELGAQITVLLGPVSDDLKKRFQKFHCENYFTVSDYDKLLSKHFPDCDMFLSLAAVLDFDVQTLEGKLSRESLAHHNQWTLPIRAVPDFSAQVARLRQPHQSIVAFALESGTESQVIERATEKMKRKGAQWLIANSSSPDSGPETNTNRMWILHPERAAIPLGLDTKVKQAEKIWFHLLNQD